MWDEVAGIVVKSAYWLLLPAALLRFYMQWARIAFRNPAGQFICALTDWLVLPLRRLVKGAFGFDWASLLAAVTFELGLALLFDLLTGRAGSYLAGSGVSRWLVLGLFGLITATLTVALWLTIASALMSWFRLDSPVVDVLDAMTARWLMPIRRRIPLLGGFDLSPLVLIVLLQVALALLARAQFHALLALR